MDNICIFTIPCTVIPHGYKRLKVVIICRVILPYIKVGNILVGQDAALEWFVSCQCMGDVLNCSLGPIMKDALCTCIHSKIDRTGCSTRQYSDEIRSCEICGLAFFFPDIQIARKIGYTCRPVNQQDWSLVNLDISAIPEEWQQVFDEVSCIIFGVGLG